MTEPVPFSDLATAAYCPRQLYYARRDDDREPPDRVDRVRELAVRYPDLRSAPAEALAAEPIAVSPRAYRERLRTARDRFADDWPAIADPPERQVLVTGRDCRGVVDKVLPGSRPSVVSAGEPPPNGVWEPDSVRAVAAALALAHRDETRVESAYVEYPAHGVVRAVPLSVHRRAAYRRTLRAVRAVDGPPPRLGDDAKCDACDYREQCGVPTRSLRSLL